MDKQQPIVIAIICFLAVTTLIYKFKPSSVTSVENELFQQQEQKRTTENVVEQPKVVKKVKIFKPKYPHCNRNDSGYLNNIIHELVFDITTCDETEKFSVCQEQEKHSYVVIYTAVSLLMVSLVFAVIEVYRVRTRLDTPGASRGGGARGDPPQLSRRCSLADLTVLRHNRRESMLRRDSAMHMSVDSGMASPRPSLKVLGSSKSQDDGGRRSSIALAKANKWQRSVSADKADDTITIPDVHHHRVHMIRHH